jgi:hypothetical protein
VVFESIAAVTAGLSALNSLFNQVKETQGNFQGIMNGLTSFQDGLQKYEIEKRASLVKPMTPAEAMKVAMAKQQIDRYNKELHLICSMSREGQTLWENYQQALQDSKERHKAQVKAMIIAKKRRQELIKTIINVSLISLVGIIIAGIIITLVIAAFT